MPNEAAQEAIETIREALGDTVADNLAQLHRQVMEHAQACRIEEAVDYIGLLLGRTSRLRALTQEPETEDFRELQNATSDFEGLVLTDFADTLVRECGCRRPVPTGNHRPSFSVELG